jgi:hypothetical protein
MSGKKRFGSFMSSEPDAPEPAEAIAPEPVAAPIPDPPAPPPPVIVTVNVPFVPPQLQAVIDAAVASIANPYPVTRRALNEAIKAARVAGLIKPQ